jgi:hypothetical protein
MQPHIMRSHRLSILLSVTAALAGFVSGALYHKLQWRAITLDVAGQRHEWPKAQLSWDSSFVTVRTESAAYLFPTVTVHSVVVIKP